MIAESAAELLTAANGIQTQLASGARVETSALDAAVPQLQSAVAAVSALAGPPAVVLTDLAPTGPAPADQPAS